MKELYDTSRKAVLQEINRNKPIFKNQVDHVSQKEKIIKSLLGMIEDQAESDLKRIDTEALSGNGKRSKTTIE